MTNEIKTEVTYFLCGGAGINAGVHLKKNSRTAVNKHAQFIGLDASNANSSDDLFPIEQMTVIGKGETKAKGSGKKRSTNYEQAESFVADVLKKHKPSGLNVIVGSSSGGSGSILITTLIRELTKKNLPFVVCFISDFTSLIERNNAVSTLRSTVAQTSQNVLGVSIPFIHFINEEGVTRGQVNDQIVDRLNLLSLFLTESNEEADYEDIKNMLTYSKHYNVAPALSQITFHDQDSAANWNGPTPVATYSLFEDRDSIVPRFSGSVVRTTGVFGKLNAKPNNTTELHMIMDHGNYLEQLSNEMTKLQEAKEEVADTFAQHNFNISGAGDDGIFLD